MSRVLEALGLRRSDRPASLAMWIVWVVVVIVVAIVLAAILH